MAKGAPLSEKQLDLLGFLYEWLDLMGVSPTNRDIADGLGIGESGMSVKLRALSFRSLVKLERDSRGFLVVGVSHPEKGDVVLPGRTLAPTTPERVFDYDLEPGAQVENPHSFRRQDIVTRACLRCRASFKTDSPFIRLCVKCKEQNADLIQMLNAPDQEYLSNLQAMLTGGLGGIFFRSRKGER